MEPQRRRPWPADLTQPDANVFGENVFSVAVQRQRLPKAVVPSARGDDRQGRAARARARRRRRLGDARVGDGARRDALHALVPAADRTRTAEKHDSFYGPTGDGNAIAEFSGKELIQGEPDASSFPSRRHPLDVRGPRLHRVGPVLAGVHPREPERRAALHPDRVHVVERRGAGQQDPAAALDGRAVAQRRSARCALLGDTTAQHVFTTVGPEQEYFLIDEQYYFERPDLVITGRTLFGAKPPKGQELDDHYFGSIPERVLACMLETEHELAKLGVPIKTRHNEVAPAQYEVAPIFENSNVGSDHQQLTMQIMQNVARRYGLVCLLHEKPFAGINGSGKHNNWSMGTDTGINLLEPGDTPHENLLFLFFCSAVIQAVNKHQQLLRASVANAGQDHRLGANEAPPAIISIFLGAELEKAFEAIESGSGDAATPQAYLEMGASVLPRLPLHGGDRNRTSPFAFTGNKFEFRALGSSMSLGMPNTVLNTIAAEAIDDARRQARRRDHRRRLARGGRAGHRQGRPGRPTSGSSSRATTTPTSGTPRPRSAGWRTSRQSPDALPWLDRAARRSRSSRSTRCSPSASSTRATRSRSSSTSPRSTSRPRRPPRSPARCSCPPRSAGSDAQRSTAAGIAQLTEETSGLVDEFVGRDLRPRGRQPRPPRGRPRPRRRQVRPDARSSRAMDAVREVADKLERIVPDDLWPLPKYSEILFIK